MPPLKPHPLDFKAWVVIGLLAGCLLASALTMFAKAPWVGSAVVTLGLVAFAVSTRRRQVRLRALAMSRHGESICEFAREFDAKVVDTWVIRAVYEEIQHELADTHPAFPVRASDNILGDLVDDPDALDMSIAPAIARRTGRSLENAEANPWYEKVQTARELVLFFNEQPKRAA